MRFVSSVIGVWNGWTTVFRRVGAVLPLASALLLVSLGLGCGSGSDAGSTATAEASSSAEPEAAAQPPPAPTETAGTAVVTGTVRLVGTAPELPPIVMGADPKCESKHDGPVANQAVIVGADGGLGNVLVSVRWTGGPVGAPREPKVVDQQGCMYTPRVLGVHTGQPLRFLNSDGILHNVHSTSEVNPAFNRAMPGAITQTDVTLEQPEDPFLVKCDVHPWMASYVMVLDHPFYAVSDPGGGFEIGGLPAGTYEIVAWHERFGAQTTTVTVEDGGAATADFTFEAEGS